MACLTYKTCVKIRRPPSHREFSRHFRDNHYIVPRSEFPLHFFQCSKKFVFSIRLLDRIWSVNVCFFGVFSIRAHYGGWNKTDGSDRILLRATRNWYSSRFLSLLLNQRSYRAAQGRKLKIKMSSIQIPSSISDMKKRRRLELEYLQVNVFWKSIWSFPLASHRFHCTFDEYSG